MMRIEDERERLQRLLNRVQATLQDADEMQIRRENTALWLRELKDFADDIEDVLDDIEYEELYWKVRGMEVEEIEAIVAAAAAASEEGSSCENSGSADCFSSQYDTMTCKIANIWKRFDEIAKHREGLPIPSEVDDEATQMEPNSQMGETSSIEAHPEVFGRDELKEEIVEFLVGTPAERLSTLTMVGIGGVGKTTLAQFVYNDERVGDYFHQKIWVHVSYDFDVIGVTRKIIEQVVSPHLLPHLNEMGNLDVLQITLANTLRDKRFFLVLDDMWYEDRIIRNLESWETLCAPLLCGGKGSKMLVTTRSAQAIGITQPVKSINLEGLGFEYSWSLFKKHAFLDRNSGSHPNLEEIGKKIVKKLNGVPLAIIAIGSLLRSKSKESEWRNILESELWELEQGEDGILPALRLSYEHLPPHLQPCFAYVSAFKKGFPFYGLEAVQLWIALGCIQFKGWIKRMEDVGSDYLHCLLSRSLIQSVDDGYIVHDLLHDLGRFVVNHDWRYKGTNQSHEISAQGQDQHYLSSQVNEHCKKRRTCAFLLPKWGVLQIHPSLFRNWTCLRVLHLQGARIMDLPDSIGDLSHLRYLDLRTTLVKHLPESLCSLYMLQTLKLQGCDHLGILPRGMSNLISLRYLEARHDLISGISGFGKLVHLQKLDVFCICEGDGIKIEDLKDMDGLRGKLCIQNLQRVVSEEEVSRANLRNKKCIKQLELEWVEDREVNERNSELEEAVLDALQPPPELKELTIKFYDGAKFPSWMENYQSISRLESISLCRCRGWDALPPLLGRLPSLKTLDIACLPKLKELPPIPTTLTHLKLQGLGFSVVSGLERVSLLQELVLCNIPNLTELPPLPTVLKILTIENLGLKALPEYYHVHSGLTADGADINNNPFLHELKIVGCQNLRSLGGVLQRQLPCLSLLSIKECKELVFWPEEEGFLATLLSLQEELIIENCPKLMELPEGSVISPSLKKLIVKGCPSFTDRSFFVQLQNLKCLTRAEDLNVEKQYRGLTSCFEEALQQMRAVDCLIISHGGVYEVPSISLCYSNSATSAPRRVDLVPYRKLSLNVISRDDDEGDEDSNCSSILSTCLRHHHLCSSLRSLCIFNMPYSTFLLPRGEEETLFTPHLPSLVELVIIGCSDMWRLPMETLLCHLRRLTCLGIFHCPELTLPSLEEAMQSLPSLEQLYIRGCPKLSLPISNSPTRVRDVEMPMRVQDPSSSSWRCSSSSSPLASSSNSSSPLPLRGLSTDDVGLLVNNQFVRDHLTSLQDLAICSPRVESFPEAREEEWPRSLRRLSFMGCHNLRELSPDFCSLLPSLVSLDLRHCPNLRCMPERGLPASLQFLDIERCPGLELDWPKLAHVRVILTDGKIMQGSYRDYEELILNGTMVRMPL